MKIIVNWNSVIALYCYLCSNSFHCHPGLSLLVFSHLCALPQLTLAFCPTINLFFRLSSTVFAVCLNFIIFLLHNYSSSSFNNKQEPRKTDTQLKAFNSYSRGISYLCPGTHMEVHIFRQTGTLFSPSWAPDVCMVKVYTQTNNKIYEITRSYLKNFNNILAVTATSFLCVYMCSVLVCIHVHIWFYFFSFAGVKHSE